MNLPLQRCNRPVFLGRSSCSDLVFVADCMDAQTKQIKPEKSYRAKICRERSYLCQHFQHSTGRDSHLVEKVLDHVFHDGRANRHLLEN
jgi:hypothetical protein